MKKLIFSALIFTLAITGFPIHSAEQATISVTATVVPSLGVFQPTDNSQSIYFAENSSSELFIQAPKNSSLLVHINNSKNPTIVKSYLLDQSSNQFTDKNSASDLLSLDLTSLVVQKESNQVITIITIDN